MLKCLFVMLQEYLEIVDCALTALRWCVYVYVAYLSLVIQLVCCITAQMQPCISVSCIENQIVTLFRRLLFLIFKLFYAAAAICVCVCLMSMSLMSKLSVWHRTAPLTTPLHAVI